MVLITSAIDLEDGAFLVGGQALNLWAERYATKTQELVAFAPYTSKDVDYFGYREAAEKLAAALHGTVAVPPLGDATPSTAVVTATINGRVVQIDFISSVLGVSARKLESSVAEIVVPMRSDEGEKLLSIPLMHPLHCLESRIANVLHPATKRRDDTAMRQLHAAPIVLREYIEEAINDGDLREVNACFQELFKYLRSDIIGRKAHAQTPVDPLDVIRHFVSDLRFDERYRMYNLTRMIEHVEDRRRRQAGDE